MSEPINDGGPAFQCPNPSALDDGMSLRDWFAGQALAGRLANSALLEHMEESGVPAELAFNKYIYWAYQLADAMLAEREKRKT